MHGLTVKGRRNENQDSILHFQPSADTFFLAVADGMGGAAGGGVASSEVLNLAYHYMQDEFGHTQHPKDLKGVLSELYRRAHQLIREKAQLDPDLEGLGTTLACVLAQGNQFVVGNLGDSRTYLLRADQLYQCSIDHTYISELQKERPGEPIDPNFVSAYGHIVTKTLDGGNEPPDLFPPEHPGFALAAGDLLVLCSDGLITDKGAGPQMLSQQLQNTRDLKTAAESLVSEALEAGSMDNISVVLARVENVPAHVAPAAPTETAPAKNTPKDAAPAVPATPKAPATPAEKADTLTDIPPTAELDVPKYDNPDEETMSGSTATTFSYPDDDPAPTAETDFSPSFGPRPPKGPSRSALMAGLAGAGLLVLAFLAWQFFSSDDPPQTSNLLPGPIPTFSFDDTLYVAQPRSTFMLARDSMMLQTVVMMPVTGTQLPLQQLTELPSGTYYWQMKIESEGTEAIGPIHTIELIDGKR